MLFTPNSSRPPGATESPWGPSLLLGSVMTTTFWAVGVLGMAAAAAWEGAPATTLTTVGADVLLGVAMGELEWGCEETMTNFWLPGVVGVRGTAAPREGNRDGR